MTPTPQPAQLDPYLETGWQLIPLHRHDKVDKLKGKLRPRGKSPLDKSWTKKPYKSSAQLAHMAAGNNVGVRLRAGEVVIDVDPRNFPDGETLDTENPFSRLCEDAGIDTSLYPTVETGSGGLHLYAKKPEDISVRDSLEDYPGVEFKTLGRQVVSAGSIHPDSKTTYDWDFLGPDLGDAPLISDRLVNLIRRPQPLKGGADGGEYDQIEVAAMLDVLDPEDFRDHGEWLTLMMSCHHASGGDARAEFVEWSTRDPEFSDEALSIGRRWDSLSAKRTDAATVTHRTLLKTLLDKDLGEHIPRTPAEDDFDDELGAKPDYEDEFLPEHERRGPVERLNDTHTAVIDGGKFKIFFEEMDPEMDTPRPFWQKLSPYDFGMLLKNRKVQRGDSTVNLAEAWLEWGGRRTARGVIFDPERNHEGFLNLWRGWAVDPKKGDWSRLNEMLFECLCNGDEAVYNYVMDWSAHMVQHPGSPAEVAVCFQGAKGVGKGTFMRALLWLCGRHGMQITSPEHLTGRFNSHLRDLIYLFADEAINPYDKSSESRLKGLITEPTLAIEAKGIDVKPAKNRLHIGMASNEDWIVPMGLDGERRFLLQRANNSKQGNSGYFDKVYSQLGNGGLEALMFDLLNRDLGTWSPRECIPATAASTEQKLRGMSPIAQWWFNALTMGAFDMELATDGNWAEAPVRLFKQDVRDNFDLWCRHNGIRPGSSGRALDMLFVQELQSLVPGLNSKTQITVPHDRMDLKPFSNGRAWAYNIPALKDCRKAMDSLLGFNYDWPLENSNMDEEDDAWLT